MVNSRILITIMSLVAITALAFNFKTTEVENFGMLNRTYRVETFDEQGNGFKGPYTAESYGCGGGCSSGELKVPSYQKTISPRMSGEGYAGAIRGAGPERFQALPGRYDAGANAQKLAARGEHEGYNGIQEGYLYEGLDGTGPTGATGILGELIQEEEEEEVEVEVGVTSEKQPIVYERYVMANQKSNLYSLGDPIRGDLAITPCKTGWFRPSVHPEIDLNQGAMAVLGGMNNETSKCTMNMINSVSGGAKRSFAGVEYDRIPDKNIAFNYGSGDVSVEGF